MCRLSGPYICYVMLCLVCVSASGRAAHSTAQRSTLPIDHASPHGGTVGRQQHRRAGIAGIGKRHRQHRAASQYRRRACRASNPTSTQHALPAHAPQAALFGNCTKQVLTCLLQHANISHCPSCIALVTCLQLSSAHTIEPAPFTTCSWLCCVMTAAS